MLKIQAWLMMVAANVAVVALLPWAGEPHPLEQLIEARWAALFS